MMLRGDYGRVLEPDVRQLTLRYRSVVVEVSVSFNFRYGDLAEKL